jgi:TDG/mug DNA glycosylase family protein
VRRLRDVIVDRPRVLFVGINPGLRSAALGHHFAGRGNPFWRLLHASGLTPTLLPAEEDHRLAELGFALTNLCPRPTRGADELERAELAAGRVRLLAKIARLQPRVVALVGVTLYPLIVGRTAAATPGAGRKPERLGGAILLVLPNPSGRNAAYPGFAHKLVWFKRLHRLIGDGATRPVTRG